MATFTITAASTGLQIVDDSGLTRLFSAPDVKLNSVPIWPRSAPTIDIRTATGLVQIALTDSVTVGGVAGAGTLSALFDQIKAVLPTGGGSGDVTQAGVQTLTNKTLTNPRIVGGDGLFNAAGERLFGLEQAAPTGNVNRLNVKAAIAGARPELLATGSDANVGINLVPKGTEGVRVNGNWIAQSNYFYNVKEDIYTLAGGGFANAAGNGTTDDAAAIQYAIYAGAGATNKIIYLPPGTYLMKSQVSISGSPITFRGAGMGKTIIKVDGTFSGTTGPFQADGKSDVTFEDLSITGNGKALDAAIRINSYNSANARIRFERVRIYNFWGAGILLGNTALTENHSNDIVTIKDCVFSGIGDPSNLVTYSQATLGHNAISLQQTTKRLFIQGCTIENCSGDGIFAYGYSQQTAQAVVPEGYGEWIISGNNITRCRMGIEINGNGLVRKIKVTGNIISYNTANQGFLVSLDGQWMDVSGNTLTNTERGALELTLIGGQVTNNIINLSAFKTGSNGLAATVLQTRIAGMELYGFANAVRGNQITLDAAGGSSFNPTEYNGIKLISRTTDATYQPTSFDGITDFSGYWDITGNTVHGFTHKAIDATNEKIRKVNIHDNKFLSRVAVESPIQIFGYDWLIQSNRFILTSSTPNSTHGVVKLNPSQAEQTNSIFSDNTVINDAWRILNPSAYFSDFRNTFQTSVGTTYVLKDYPEMTLTQRNAIGTPIAGMIIYQTDNTPGRYRYNGSAWVAY